MKSNTAERVEVEMVAKYADTQHSKAVTPPSAIEESRAIAIDLAVHQAKLDGRWERMREESALQLQISRQTPW